VSDFCYITKVFQTSDVTAADTDTTFVTYRKFFKCFVLCQTFG